MENSNIKVFVKKIRILGTRGVPAQHGGFETFAEQLALYLVGRGWDTTVYCQVEGVDKIYEDQWGGIRRVNIGVNSNDAWNTVLFDARCVRHARREHGLLLTLGYNTAIFSLAYFGLGLPHVMNMDGIEWRRDKWTFLQKVWLYFNEWAGCWLADKLIADHPEIGHHLQSRVSAKKISVIPYGSDALYTEKKVVPSLKELCGKEINRYAMVVARPEPENSILEIVKAFSRRKRYCHLLVVGPYDVKRNSYHRLIQKEASSEVCFIGPIYDKKLLGSLRCSSVLYIHGHTVGGTNPSLVEALGAGNPVLAHDNIYNRWVAGKDAEYFCSIDQCDEKLNELLNSPKKLKSMSLGSIKRYKEKFTWTRVLKQYEELLEELIKLRG